MKFWTWWTISNLGVIAVALAAYFLNLFDILYTTDSTGLSFIIMGITLITTISLYWQKVRDWHWFVSDSVLSLGMVGTLYGFLIILGQAFVDVDTSSTESMTAVISLLASGMSTALVTSLVGLVASLFLKLQLVVIEGE
jgi:hypothetical protein